MERRHAQHGDAYVDNGGKVARFAGNFLWQTRLSDQGKTQTCYKYIAETDPFLNGPNPELTTSAWDIAPANRPGALTFGVNALNGIYAGLGRCVGNGAGALLFIDLTIGPFGVQDWGMGIFWALHRGSLGMKSMDWITT